MLGMPGGAFVGGQWQDDIQIRVRMAEVGIAESAVPGRGTQCRAGPRRCCSSTEWYFQNIGDALEHQVEAPVA